MQIDIGNKYVITGDARQFVLNERKIKGEKAGENAGEDYLQPIGFYQSISGVVAALIGLSVRLSDVQSLQAMEQHINRISLQCEQAFAEKA
jgi:hypothetical protein